MKKRIVCNIKEGIHARIAAKIVNKANELKYRYKINPQISVVDKCSTMDISMLALIALNISKGDIIEISTVENSHESTILINTLIDYILSFGDTSTLNEDINLSLEETTIATQHLLNNVSLGVIATDTNFKIQFANLSSLRLLKNTLENILGKNFSDVVESLDIQKWQLDSQKLFSEIIHTDKAILLITISPIIEDDQSLGTIITIQDISNVVSLKEINGKLNKILELSHDSICLVNELGNIDYINPAYEQTYNVEGASLIGKSLNDISPNGLRMQVFKSRTAKDTVLSTKNDISVICNVTPLFVENEFKGVISISKPTAMVKDFLNLISNNQEKINYYKEELSRVSTQFKSFSSIIGSTTNLRKVIAIAERASSINTSVLIRGESGTGKEVLADAIHNSSPRKDEAFIRVNCAAIPENLIESELFGHEKGSFTGAVRSKPGKFHIANKGTIFLDEIGDMPLSMQVKLLRVLQEREFEKVGGITIEKVDVRVIAATNRNLEDMIKNGQFREDLYYRLNVISLTLPPLRERKDDINELTDHLLIKLAKKHNLPLPVIDPECLTLLKNYDWPGNIRELENILERALTLCYNNIITPSDFPSYIYVKNRSHSNLINTTNGEVAKMEDYEREIIKAAMKKYKSFNKAGKALGLTHRTVSLKCKKYNIT